MFIPHDRYGNVLTFENSNGWQSLVNCISKHSTTKDISGIIEELTKNKKANQISLRNPMKKLGTIYQRKGGILNSPKIAENKKTKTEQRIYDIKNEINNIKNRLNNSK